jgi:sensor domain CHASE-containing protein
MLTAADSQDRLAADKSIALLYNVLGERRHQLGQLTRDYSWWDDAAVNLALSPNAEWATENIGPYLTNSFHVGVSIVVDPDNRRSLAFVDGVPATDQDLPAKIAGGFDRLAADARAAPADAPQAATGFLRINGEVHIAAASLIVPAQAELRDAYEPQRWAHVLVFTQPLDGEALQSLAARFGLRDLAFRSGPPDEQTSSLRLAGPDRKELGFLSWRAEAPGYAMLRQLALPVAIAFDIMVVLAVLIVRQIGRLDRENRRILEELVAKNGNLEQLTALQRATLDVVPGGIAVFDRDLCLLAWNQTFAALHDYPAELLRAGVPLVRLLRHSAQTGSFPEPDADAVVADHLAAAARCDPQPTRLTFADGRNIELRRSGASDGRIVLTYRLMSEDAARRPPAATARELLRVVERSAAPSA